MFMNVLSVVAVIVAIILIWSLALYPRWKVWNSHQNGRADLARADNEQRIQVAAATARLAAAELNKKAAIIEATAVSESIKVIGTQLTEHGLYLRWQWIRMMEDRNAASDTIYVPTEANLPILEATRKS